MALHISIVYHIPSPIHCCPCDGADKFYVLIGWFRLLIRCKRHGVHAIIWATVDAT